MKTAKQHFEQAYLENNVIRWNSNDTVPPLEILTELFIAGYITREIHFDSMAAKKVEDAAFLEQYIANRRKYGYSDEEKFEMQAAFAGETVVDIFTGEVVQYA
jgi:hypothetical protein